MLSHEDNERLVRVGKGTPLGELFRLYWIPFLPSADLVSDGVEGMSGAYYWRLFWPRIKQCGFLFRSLLH